MFTWPLPLPVLPSDRWSLWTWAGPPYWEEEPMTKDQGWVRSDAPHAHLAAPLAVRTLEERIADAIAAIVSANPETVHLEQALMRIFIEEGLIKRFVPRQLKYGTGNIAAFGSKGVVVRATDKLARLKRYYFEDTEDFNDETIIDSWADLMVYAGIALMCALGEWPGVQGELFDDRR